MSFIKCNVELLTTDQKANIGDLALSSHGVLNIAKNKDWCI